MEALAADFRRELGVGKAGRLLRAFRLGGWMPDALSAPAATLAYAGTRRDAAQGLGENGGSAVQSTMAASLILDLPAQWDRDGAGGEFLSLVEDVETLLAGFAQRAAARELGVIEARLIADEPLTAVLESGESKQVWILDLEIEYAAEMAV
jgi:hypothetical protein